MSQITNSTINNPTPPAPPSLLEISPLHLDLRWLLQQLQTRKEELPPQLLAEYKQVSFRHLPIRNKTLLHYELLQRSTDKIDLSKMIKFPFTIYGETFTAYSLQGVEFRFLIHAMRAWEADVKTNLKAPQILCLSLISNEVPDFYRQQDYYAAVLSVNPNAIVKTSLRDMYTPYDIKDPQTLVFYNTQHRLQILASYIDEFYRYKIGKIDSHASTLRRLSSLQKVDPQEERSNILANSPLTGTQSLYDCSETQDKILELLNQEKTPDDYPELIDCLKLLDFSERLSLSPLISPHNLLSQTAAQPPYKGENNGGKTPYNEINLDLRYCPNAIQLKAILVNLEAVEANPLRFLPVLRYAKANNLPIFLKPESKIHSFETLKEMAQTGNSQEMQKLLESTIRLDESHVAHALVIAAQNQQDEMLRFLIENCPDIPSTLIKQAFFSVPSSSYAPLTLRLLQAGIKIQQIDLPKAIETAKTEGQLEIAKDLEHFFQNQSQKS